MKPYEMKYNYCPFVYDMQTFLLNILKNFPSKQVWYYYIAHLSSKMTLKFIKLTKNFVTVSSNVRCVLDQLGVIYSF